jgi:hypothetical protein
MGLIMDRASPDLMMNRIYRKKPDIISRNIAGQAILVPVRGKVADMQRIFMLNSVAEFVWEQLSGEIPVNRICRRVEENFTVIPTIAENDVCELINNLLDLELIFEVC